MHPGESLETTIERMSYTTWLEENILDFDSWQKKYRESRIASRADVAEMFRKFKADQVHKKHRAPIEAVREEIQDDR